MLENCLQHSSPFPEKQLKSTIGGGGYTIRLPLNVIGCAKECGAVEDKTDSAALVGGWGWGQILLSGKSAGER